MRGNWASWLLPRQDAGKQRRWPCAWQGCWNAVKSPGRPRFWSRPSQTEPVTTSGNGSSAMCPGRLSGDRVVVANFHGLAAHLPCACECHRS